MEPVPWSAIEGGREHLDESFASIKRKAEKLQARFAAALDSLGPPGMASWDPIAGTIELRGTTFRAQMLGSFDGSSWLWSWANPHLAIPEELTSYARGLRDQAGRLTVALRTPMIEDHDEALPHMLGGLAIGHDFGEAFYIANQAQVYLLVPGQLDNLKPRPIRFATCFSHARRSLADIVTHLRGDKNLKGLDLVQVDDDRATLSGTGYAIEIRRRDRLRDVLAEVKEIAVDQELARGAATVFTIEGTIDPTYTETTYTISHGLWAPAEQFTGMPWQVIAICERLNQLDRVALYDTLLCSFYPRS